MAPGAVPYYQRVVLAVLMSSLSDILGTVATTGPWRPSFAVLPRRTISGHWIWLQCCYIRDITVYALGSYAEPYTLLRQKTIRLEPDVQWARDGFEVLGELL